jgi:hypothetical protein
VDLDAEHRPLVSPGTGQALYKFVVHLRHPDYRLVISADAPFPSGASEADWRHIRSREAGDVNAEVRDAVARDGYSLFRIGLSLSDIP